jgi:hypothetical protein
MLILGNEAVPLSIWRAEVGVVVPIPTVPLPTTLSTDVNDAEFPYPILVRFPEPPGE